MKLLTPLELKVMNILWGLKKAFVKEILERWPDERKPAYNTISTTIRILQEKEYVSYQAFGRTHQYYPLVSKFEYQKRLVTNVLQDAFSGSVSSLFSALVDEKHVSEDDLDDIQSIINENKSEQDKDNKG